MGMLPILDYASQPPRDVRVLKLTLALVAFAVSILNLNLTCCMCGYQDWISVPGNLVGVALAIGAFCLTSRSLIARVPSGFALIVCTLILALNVHNILWSGHDPIFP